MYDDDGKTNDYKQGKYLKTLIEVKAGAKTDITFTYEGHYCNTIDNMELDVIHREKAPYYVLLDGNEMPHYLHRGKYEQAEIERYIYIVFGYKKFTLTYDDETKSYSICRENGDIAKNLSEGEKTVIAKLNGLMNADMEQSFKLGMEHFGHLIHGFDRKDAILSGMETRTSSPLRIKRDESFESNISGVYPCGEGAGYAGGITSAAIDGIKVAEAIIKKYRPDFK